MRNKIRQNVLTGQWVIYAPDRADRPRDYSDEDSEHHEERSQYDANCPFCAGNGEMLTDIIYQHKARDGKMWRTRVVPNKYPMLSPDQQEERSKEGPYVEMGSYGHHEVIIEHPRHDLDLVNMEYSDVEIVIETYHRRYRDLMQQHQNMMGVIFRNHGASAGTSIRHPHSQIVVTGLVPRYVRWREHIAQNYYDTWGQSLMGDMLAYELQTKARIVDENEAFVVLVPYAAEVPFECWIVPRRQCADFGDITDTEKLDMTNALLNCLKRQQFVLHNPAYNYVIHTAARYKAGEPHLHWYIQVRPRTVTPAGFELGSGMLVNPSLPENDADNLRRISL